MSWYKYWYYTIFFIYDSFGKDREQNKAFSVVCFSFIIYMVYLSLIHISIKFYYEKVRKGKRQYYGGIARAKEYKALPEVLSREEMKSIFAQLSNRKHRCMISLIYSAGLRRSELLNLTPQDLSLIHI